MFEIDPALWPRLSPILDAALDLPAERRDSFLDEACAREPRLRDIASQWLAAAERPSALLDRPVMLPAERWQGSSATTRDLEDGVPARPPGRFLPETVVGGRYRIVALIGRGGMGDVYRADDLRLGTPVALKFLPPNVERDSPRVQRLLRELRTARQVAHPNVCRVWDVGEHEGSAFLTMEFVDGESLAALLKRIGPLPRDRAIDLARQICAGLAAMHEQTILHRDLKPGNVMIDGRGRVHIIDFSIASLVEEVSWPVTVIGTPGYMSPEQLAGRKATIRSEIYVLGLLLYELFTGRRAFQANSLAELRRLQEESAPTSPARLVDGLDASIERIILNCLARDPSERPESAQAVASALP